jgi:iron(III) transport system ATP-binding protein
VIPPLLELSSIVKSYGGLRPLRIERLLLAPDERVAIVGIDQAGAEVLVNLITGATLPDQGRVVLFGRASDAIATSDEWLALVDRFGIVSARAVLLEELSVVQNVAVPFSLDIEPLDDELRARAVALGAEAGLPPTSWDQPVSALGASDRLRLRLARGLALGPSIVLLEHPSADVVAGDRAALGKEIHAVLEARGAAAIALTSDQGFAVSFADRVLNFDPASGRLPERRRGWFGSAGGGASKK